jgi:hypothetical protein
MTSVFSGTDIRAAQNLLYFKTDFPKMGGYKITKKFLTLALQQSAGLRFCRREA